MTTKKLWMWLLLRCAERLHMPHVVWGSDSASGQCALAVGTSSDVLLALADNMVAEHVADLLADARVEWAQPEPRATVH